MQGWHLLAYVPWTCLLNLEIGEKPEACPQADAPRQVNGPFSQEDYGCF